MTATINEPPIIKDWHRPKNEACPQNSDIDRDCECEKPKRVCNRKPYRVCKVHDANVPHRVKPDIIIEIHPNGRLIFRERGRPRRFSYGTTVAKVYGRLLMNEAMAKAHAKNAKKNAKKKARQDIKTFLARVIKGKARK